MLKILFILSVRSLRTHKITTGIVGSIIFFGSWLLITGTAMVDSLESSLAKTLISSVAGHLQVYSAAARDDLALFGSGFAAVDDVGQMPNFGKVRDALEKDDNVQAVVPMGIQYHALVLGNELDQVLMRLNHATRQGHGARIEALAHQVRDIARDIQHEAEERAVISADADSLRLRLAAVRRVQLPAFWQALRRDPATYLQFLDTHVAPLAGTAPPIYLRNLGTNLQAFTRSFDRFQLVDGQMVPPNTRGFLFAKRTYETDLKHPVARTLDEIHAGLAEPGRSLAGDVMLRSEAERLPEQYKRITFQLSPDESVRLTGSLRTLLRVKGDTLVPLLRSFLAVTDANFAERYKFFYDVIAPMVQLHTVRIGDVMTLSAVTHAGYTKSVKVRVYGTFEFSGLSKSPMAGMQNLMDLVTFRELYGARDAGQEQELAALRRTVEVQDIGRDEAEAQMFTDTTVQAERTRGGQPAQVASANFSEAKRLRNQGSETFLPQDLDSGLALNAAVLLRHPSQLSSTQEHLQDLVHKAGLAVQVVDWRSASGLVSRFVTVVHLFIYAATGIIFLVALVIMSNAMTMATAERAREIGTIRAIGGQRRFILMMYFFETLTLGLFAGTLGCLAGLASIGIMHSHGIAAATDVMVFLFSGPRLYPTLGLSNILFGFTVVLFVTLISTLYPARVATRIAPVVAMQAKE